MIRPVAALRAELDQFGRLPEDVKKLILANFLYTFAIAFMNIFVTAYIFNQADNATVILYYLGEYIGLPVVFTLNGMLMRRVSVKVLYSLGMVASVSTILLMMTLDRPAAPVFFGCGVVVGLCYGLHWANRNFLVLSSTDNLSRNYYTGLEFMLVTLVMLISPILTGSFIAEATASGLLTREGAYRTIVAGILVLCSLAALVIMRGRFETPPMPRFVYFRFVPVWTRMQAFSFLKGAIQGGQIILPSLLIMNLVGKEMALGVVNSVCGVIGAIAVYITGRVARPEQRLLVYAVSAAMFTAGALTHSVMFSAVSVLIWMALQTASDPLSYAGYLPMMMRAMDVAAEQEGRPAYAYVANHEIWINLGRVVGCALFLALLYRISEAFALRHFLTVVGLAQIAAIWVARRLPT